MSATHLRGRVARKGVLHAVSGFFGSAISLCGYPCHYDIREGEDEPTCKWCRERLNLGPLPAPATPSGDTP